MEYELHIPTEQYGFILRRFTGTPDEAVRAYREVREAWDKPKSEYPVGNGLSPATFNKVLDAYLANGTLTADEYGEMNLEQQKVIQEIKKSRKRTNK